MNISKHKLELITGIGFITLFSLSIFFLSSLSTGYVANFQNHLLKAIIETGGQSPLQALGNTISTVLSSIIGLILLALSFTFLSVYGLFKKKDKLGIIIGAIAGLIVLIFFNFSIIGFILFPVLILISWYSIPLAKTYFQELSRLKYYRSSAKTIGKVLLILNIAIALGLFLSINSDLASYQQQHEEVFTSLLVDSMVSENMMDIEGLDSSKQSELNQAFQEQARAAVEGTIKNTPVFQTYITWLPIVIPITVWIILEFFRSLILTNISELFSSLLVRLYRLLD